MHIESYTKAQDLHNFAEVIEIANRVGSHDELVKYLQMVHKTLLEPSKIDTELAYVYIPWRESLCSWKHMKG